MKQNRYVRKAGPFVVHSISQDGHGVRLVVYPAFPQYNLSDKKRQREDIDPSWQAEPRWAIHRLRGDGGGPGIFTAMGLAQEMQNFLNQPYSEAEVQEWKATLKEALAKVTAARGGRCEALSTLQRR